MIQLDVFALKSKSEVESYEFFDKNVRKLPKNANGTFDKSTGLYDDNDVDAVRHAYEQFHLDLNFQFINIRMRFYLIELLKKF